MARHRSSRGRFARPPSSHALATSAAGGGRGAHRSVICTPLRRGAAAGAVASGTLSLVGVGVPVVIESTDVAELAASVAPPGAVEQQPAAQPLAQPDPLVRTALEPVAHTPETAATDGAALVKAVRLVEQQLAAQAATEQQAAEESAVDEQAAGYPATEGSGSGAVAGSPGCDLDTSGLGAVKPHVMDAAEFLGCLFGEPAMHGVAGRGGPSDHPAGLAVDFMVDRATGDRLAECALRNQDALGIKYVIWKQRINHGNGWVAMENRGNVTANHFDHVHVSFTAGAGSGDPATC